MARRRLVRTARHDGCRGHRGVDRTPPAGVRTGPKPLAHSVLTVARRGHLTTYAGHRCPCPAGCGHVDLFGRMAALRTRRTAVEHIRRSYQPGLPRSSVVLGDVRRHRTGSRGGNSPVADLGAPDECFLRVAADPLRLVDDSARWIDCPPGIPYRVDSVGHPRTGNFVRASPLLPFRPLGYAGDGVVIGGGSSGCGVNALPLRFVGGCRRDARCGCATRAARRDHRGDARFQRR